jgi:hypothetical protein
MMDRNGSTAWSQTTHPASATFPLGQDARVDLVVSKLSSRLTEAETTKPHADIHGRAPHGLTG